jgi:hypothetical protein
MPANYRPKAKQQQPARPDQIRVVVRHLQQHRAVALYQIEIRKEEWFFLSAACESKTTLGDHLARRSRFAGGATLISTYA